MNIDLKELLGDAADLGLGQAAIDLMTSSNLDQDIQAAMGSTDVDSLPSETLLINRLLDNSGSIRSISSKDPATGQTIQGEDLIITGYNLVDESLLGSKQANGFLAHTRLLDGSILVPYQKLKVAPRLSRQNYAASLGHTPLFRESFTLLTSVLAKAASLRNDGIAARSITLIVTDGGDTTSGTVERDKLAAKVKTLVDDMLSLDMHIVAGMGIDDGHTDFREVFRSMGIRDQWILTPKASASEIREAFRLFSQSATQASQSPQSFSQSAQGGFT